MKTRIVIDIEIDSNENYFNHKHLSPSDKFFTTINIRPLIFSCQYSMKDASKLDKMNWHPETMLRIMFENQLKCIMDEWAALFQMS